MLTKMKDREPIAASRDELGSLKALSRLLREGEASELSIVGGAGEALPLGDAVLRVLRRTLDELAEDRVVVISSLTKDLTLDQVADLLGVPYSDAVRRVEERNVSMHEMNGLPLVRFEDAMVLKKERDTEQEEALQFLADQGQEIQAMMDRAAGRATRRTRAMATIGSGS